MKKKTLHFTVAIICASDRSFNGLRNDVSTPVLENLLQQADFSVTEKILLPDSLHDISHALYTIACSGTADLILTTGGTGVSVRDVTPEATAAVAERLIPGISEYIRTESMKKTPNGMLSRGIAGIYQKTLIINLPGSPKALQEIVPTILPAVKHALGILTDRIHDCTFDT